MDAARFDCIAKQLFESGTRRGFVRLLAGLSLSGSLTLLLGAGPAGAAAKSGEHGSSHRRHRRKARQRHGPDNDQRRRQRRQRDKDKNKQKKGNTSKKKRTSNGKDGREGNQPRPDPGCQPESPAETCAGTCGMVANRCGTKVDCDPCGCDPPCGPCMTCDAATTTCVPSPPICCGNGDGVCIGGACRSCGTNRRCVGDGVCVCDAISCPNGCCDLSATCRIDDDLACGTGGAVCFTTCRGAGETCGGGGQVGVCGCQDDGKACANQTCGTAVNNCGETVQCSGCAGCCTESTPGGWRSEYLRQEGRGMPFLCHL